MSCDKILLHDWTALYSAAEQGLCTQFTRPFPLLRKWVLLAIQVSAVNNFIDQGEFGAMKTLSDRIAPRCDKHKLCDEMTVRTVFELSLFEQSGRNEEEE